MPGLMRYTRDRGPTVTHVDPILTLSGAAAEAGVSRQAVRGWVFAGVGVGDARVRLRAVRAGGRGRLLLVTRRDLDRFLERVGRRRVPPA
jgi:hypothetical protein